MSIKLKKALINNMVKEGRSSGLANFDDPTLGPLKLLPGKWANTEELKGYGFNMMALPFHKGPNGYRLLMNQYGEELHFAVVDKGVPNRGNTPDPDDPSSFDQTVVSLSYFQKIKQIDSADSPATDLNQRFNNEAIHKEPGLWLYMTNHETAGVNIARLGTIPHGNSFLAPGRFEEESNFIENPSDIQLIRMLPRINGIVVGGGTDPAEPDLEPPYFAPYKHFHENPYKGSVEIPGFDGFDPVHAANLLRHTLENVIMKVGKVKRVMRLHVDSTINSAGIQTFQHGGIFNIPFVVREADASAMNATFVMYEVEDAETGKIRHFMQYAQNVILDFINRPDGHPGRARWPHVSVNTMERVADSTAKSVMDAIV